MPKESKPIPLEIKEHLSYSENSPSGLYWTEGWESAGYLNSKERWVVKYNQQLYKAHRVIWFLHHGNLSETLEIDHKDGNPKNNLIENLRIATSSENNRNRGIRSTKKSGLPKGVHWSTSKGANPGYMCARVYVGKKSYSKSGFNLEELVAWLEAKREELHKDFANHG